MHGKPRNNEDSGSAEFGREWVAVGLEKSVEYSGGLSLPDHDQTARRLA